MFTGFEKRIRRAADTGARAESDGKSFCAVTNNTMIKRQARMINIFVSAARFDKSGFLIMTGGVFHSRRSVFRLHVNTCAFENHVGRIHFAYCVFNSLEYIRRTVEIRFYDGKKKRKNKYTWCIQGVPRGFPNCFSSEYMHIFGFFIIRTHNI